MKTDYPGRNSCGCPFINHPDPAAHYPECHYRLNSAQQAAVPVLWAARVNGVIQQTGSESICREWADAWGVSADLVQLYAAPAAQQAAVPEKVERPPYAHICVGMPAALHPHTQKLLERFTHALAVKLRAAEQKYGYSNGWMGNGWMEECRAKLMQHVKKGDPRDVAAYCAFLWHHGESTTSPAAPQQGDANRDARIQDEREAVALQRYLFEHCRNVRPPHAGLMGWALAALTKVPKVPQQGVDARVIGYTPGMSRVKLQLTPGPLPQWLELGETVRLNADRSAQGEKS